MQDQSSFVINNGEDDTWMKKLVLTYAQAHPADLWSLHTTAMVIETEVQYDGHRWRAVPYAHPTVYPRLELRSATTTTVVAVPVDVFVKVISVLNKRWEEDLWVMKSRLIGLANASVRDKI